MRGMQQAAEGLQKIVSRSLRQASPAEAPLLAWPVACGATVAGKTRALDYADGVLRVQVPDAGWRTELKALASHYLAIINRNVPQPVTRIEFVVVGKVPSKGVHSIR
jgi:predicted nucleic acid-binding Zn ribbon protein